MSDIIARLAIFVIHKRSWLIVFRVRGSKIELLHGLPDSLLLRILMVLCVTLIQAYHKQYVYLQGGGGGCFIGSIIKVHAHLLKAA